MEVSYLQNGGGNHPFFPNPRNKIGGRCSPNVGPKIISPGKLGKKGFPFWGLNPLKNFPLRKVWSKKKLMALRKGLPKEIPREPKEMGPRNQEFTQECPLGKGKGPNWKAPKRFWPKFCKFQRPKEQ